MAWAAHCRTTTLCIIQHEPSSTCWLTRQVYPPTMHLIAHRLPSIWCSGMPKQCPACTGNTVPVAARGHRNDLSASIRLPLCSLNRRSASFLSTSASIAITSMSAWVTFTAASSFSLQTGRWVRLLCQASGWHAAQVHHSISIEDG